jgi:DNA mismatch repair protein MutL
VDQHAAHESILYALFQQTTNNTPITLLFPEIITITREQMHIIEPYLYILNTNGIIIESFGHTQLRVTALPASNKHTATYDLIHQLLANIEEYHALDQEQLITLLHKKLRAQMACKAAVKAGDILNMQQMQTLLKDLYKSENHLTCPHGRPTCWLIPLYDIEKKFKRKL